VVAVEDGAAVTEIDQGADPFDPTTLFELGSITKTMTGFLLADSVLAGECGLDTAVGDILGPEAGEAARTTLLQLATHTSGLPRLPVNFAPKDRKDPYADLTSADLVAALGDLDPLVPGPYVYSNLGFMLLALLLERVTGSSYEDLLQDRLLRPAGMGATTTNPPTDGRLPGYDGPTPVPWWNGPPGSGRVVSTLTDMERYLRLILDPQEAGDRVAAAVELAISVHHEGPPTEGLAWVHQGGGIWHNGGTGGCHTFACVYRPTRSAVFLVANGAGLDVLDKVGFGVITQLARGEIGTPLSG